MNRTHLFVGAAVALTAIAVLGIQSNVIAPAPPVPANPKHLRNDWPDLAPVAANPGPCLGYTWSLRQQEGAVARVGSDPVGSNAYRGDTDCNKELPLLCLHPSGRPAPAGFRVTAYSGWASGELALSKPVPGNALASRETADRLCAENFGEGWRIGEHHDGRESGSIGWGFAAYGEVPKDTRFWVAINDQPANPWNQVR